MNMHHENKCKTMVRLLKECLINFYIKRLRSISATKQQLQNRSTFTSNPTNDQLYELLVDISHISKRHSIFKSQYELLAESALDNIAEIDDFRHLLSELTERDIYRIENPFIKHDFYRIEEKRYFLHIAPRRLSIIDDRRGRLILR